MTHTLVSSHHDVRGSLEVLGEEVAEGVVLLQHGKVGRVAHPCGDSLLDARQARLETHVISLTGEDLFGDLLLIALEQEQLEPWKLSAIRPLRHWEVKSKVGTQAPGGCSDEGS